MDAPNVLDPSPFGVKQAWRSLGRMKASLRYFVDPTEIMSAAFLVVPICCTRQLPSDGRQHQIAAIIFKVFAVIASSKLPRSSLRSERYVVS